MLKRISSYLISTLLLACVMSISVLSQSKKTAYGVLVDNTGSLRTQFPQVLLLGEGSIKRISQRGPVSLFNFITKREGKETLAVVTTGVEWSQDENDLSNYLNSVSVVTGQTTLLEAIHSIAEELNAKANTEKENIGEKVIILITDGEHRMIWDKKINNSLDEAEEKKKRENRLIKELKENGIKVYAVGLVRELDADDGGLIRKSSRENAETFLKKIAKETGGRVVFPKSKKIDVDKVLNELLTQ